MLLLSGNLGEVLIIFLAVILGLNLPLTAIMLLWINMVTDGDPALAFSVDHYGRDTMLRNPRPKEEGILPRSKLMLITALGIVGTAIALLLFSLYGGSSGEELELTLARTMVFNFVVLYEMILVFVIRHGYQVSFFSNRYIWASVLLSALLQAVLMYTPPAGIFPGCPLKRRRTCRIDGCRLRFLYHVYSVLLLQKKKSATFIDVHIYIFIGRYTHM
ncbi:MAG: cation transporting ATPase C-terminal domain-containing protein [Desulfobulbaceae bacterium]|nr:cation transporting ATPase C-terminal domain-containing protein [Desulfobulbaceae bacterium]